MKRTIALYLICFFTLIASAQKIHPDSSIGNVDERVFDHESLENYKQNPTYIYDDAPSLSTNPVKAWWQNMWRKFGDFMERATSPLFWKILRFLIIIAVVLLLVYHLSNSEKSGILGKRNARIGEAEVILESGDLMISEIDKMVHNCESSEDYRMAIRWLYLKTIRNLSVLGIVKKSENTPNNNMLSQIKNDTVKEDFRKLIFIYEYIWYGKHALNSAGHYGALKSNFDNFNQSILTKV